jgi:hypothetical protein
VHIKGPWHFTAQTVSRAAGSYIEVESGNHTVNENGGKFHPIHHGYGGKSMEVELFSPQGGIAIFFTFIPHCICWS